MDVDQRDFLQRRQVLSGGRLRICLRLADSEHHVQHHLQGQWRIYDTNNAGDREPSAQLHLESVAPGHFNNPAIVPLGGTETRALLFMDGSLYAGIGDWMDPDLNTRPTPGAQVLRLDSPTGSWVEDQNYTTLFARSR